MKFIASSLWMIAAAGAVSCSYQDMDTTSNFNATGTHICKAVGESFTYQVFAGDSRLSHINVDMYEKSGRKVAHNVRLELQGNGNEIGGKDYFRMGGDLRILVTTRSNIAKYTIIHSRNRSTHCFK